MMRVPCGDPLDGYGLPATSHRRQGTIRGAGAGARITVSFGIYGLSLPAEVHPPATASICVPPVTTCWPSPRKPTAAPG